MIREPTRSIRPHSFSFFSLCFRLCIRQTAIITGLSVAHCEQQTLFGQCRITLSTIYSCIPMEFAVVLLCPVTRIYKRKITLVCMIGTSNIFFPFTAFGECSWILFSRMTIPLENSGGDETKLFSSWSGVSNPKGTKKSRDQIWSLCQRSFLVDAFHFTERHAFEIIFQKLLLGQYVTDEKRPQLNDSNHGNSMVFNN